MHDASRLWWIAGALILVVVGSVAAGWYGYTQFTALSQRVAELEGTLASTTIMLEADIAKTNTLLSATRQEQNNTVAQVKDQLSNVTGTVDTLDKLSKIDPQLLAKYSKVYFLNENYVPTPLVDIPALYEYVDRKQLQILGQVLPNLTSMLTQAKSDGVDIYVDSAYRSFGEQALLKNQYTVVYGAGTANQFSAEQGYSEHQLGTTVDLITTGLGGRLTQAFDQSKAYQWLTDNAHRYGFILSYPKGNHYYIYEPWHWRFVGVKLATDLHTKAEYFYDLDQRTIDTYLISIFD